MAPHGYNSRFSEGDLNHGTRSTLIRGNSRSRQTALPLSHLREKEQQLPCRLALKLSLLKLTGNLMQKSSLRRDSPAHFPNHRNIKAKFPAVGNAGMSGRVSILDAVKQLHVQTLVPKPPVKILYVAILRRLARSNKFQLDAVPVSPLIHRPRIKSRTVVHSNAPRIPTQPSRANNAPRNLLSRERSVGLKHHAFSTKVVDHA